MPAKTINVVLTVETGPECLKAMRAVSPGIALLNAAGLLLEEQNGDRRAKAELDSILSTADIVCELLSAARCRCPVSASEMDTGTQCRRGQCAGPKLSGKPG